MKNNLCSYGCGKESIIRFKNGKYCCSLSKNQCSSVIEFNRIRNSGRKCSEETKIKMSLTRKGKVPWNKNITGYHVFVDEETKKRMLEKRRGKPGSMKGKHHSEESKLKISCKNKGLKRSEEQRKNYSNALKGIKFSDEHRRKLSESGKKKVFSDSHKENLSNSLKGERNGFFGKHHSEKSKLKLKMKNKGRKHSEETRQKIIKSLIGRKCTNEAKEKHRQHMLKGGAVKANSGIQNPSKPQVELYNRIKIVYPSAVLNYPLYELNYSLDIAIPELKIWFESDGSWWHQDKEKDLERQRKIENLGWKCIRYSANSIKEVPTVEKVKEDLSWIM